MKTVLFVILILSTGYGWSQNFPVTGQLANTAFPVCGSDTFKQTVVPFGHTHTLQVPGCSGDGAVYADTNPFWYTFTCYSAGSLGFLITPNNLGDDYDWMLYDITNHQASEVYTNTSLIVAGNWAGTFGLTGARPGGIAMIGCASNPNDNHNTFSVMPNLKLGHQYLLLVSHFTDDSQSGYSLSFGGGSAVITDTTKAHLKSANINCDRKTLVIALNKNMRCASVAADGSDFLIPSEPLAITQAMGINCSGSFDMDSVLITLSAPLAPGSYSVVSKIGTDDNTLTDDCGNQLPVGESLSFDVLPPHATPFDSLTPPHCAPSTLQLVFSDMIQCSSIAPDGSDFSISGPGSIGIISASCQGDMSGMVNIKLSSPIVVGGDYQVMLKTGTDGNTIINECGVETPGGGAISFAIKDTVSASFNYSTNLGCKYDTLHLGYVPANGVDQWQWIVDTVETSSLVSPDLVETVFGVKTVQHIVSNGFCSDSVTEIVDLDNLTKALFNAPREVCPKDALNINDSSIGHLVSWYWSFGDGEISTDQNPSAHLFPNTPTGKTYTVTLVVKDNLGCYDTASQQIIKLQSCYITVPNAFTPNGDGKNDFLYPLNGNLATNLEFQVYNRYGQLVFETRDWSKKWDGTIGGKPQPTGTYVWMLHYTDGASGKSFFLRGTSVLIR
ncbi:MAG TPA: gliding motility-associated C-terminal domain-containing protein [Puia sp.]